MPDLVAYLLLGALAGTLAGLLGVGGGLVIVPVLAMVFTAHGLEANLVMHLALGTSLATIVFTSISSVWAHHRHGAVQWPVFARMSPGIALGAWFGAVVAHLLPSTELRVIFGVFELSVAAQMGFSIKANPHRQLPGWQGLNVGAAVIGTVSAVVGIGGGTMTVPFLTWCNLNVRQAVATSAACGLPIALAGASGYVVNGLHAPGLPDAALGYLYGPAFFGIVVASMAFAPLGARLAHTLPAPVLKRFFAAFLAVLGVRMLWG